MTHCTITITAILFPCNCFYFTSFVSQLNLFFYRNPNAILNRLSLFYFLFSAFNESGHFDESYRVLDRLLVNSINENRFHDASYYSWLMANYFGQLGNSSESLKVTDQVEQALTLDQHAKVYYAYHLIYKYVVCPLHYLLFFLFDSIIFDWKIFWFRRNRSHRCMPMSYSMRHCICFILSTTICQKAC